MSEDCFQTENPEWYPVSDDVPPLTERQIERAIRQSIAEMLAVSLERKRKLLIQRIRTRKAVQAAREREGK